MCSLLNTVCIILNFLRCPADGVYGDSIRFGECKDIISYWADMHSSMIRFVLC